MPEWDIDPPLSPDVQARQPGQLGPDVDLSDSEPEHVEPAREADTHQASMPKVFMPLGFEIPALQHVCDNLYADTHLSMSWWAIFFSYLKQFECLLTVDERRMAYVFFCLRCSAVATMESKFLRFKGSLHEGLWREVLFFLKAFWFLNRGGLQKLLFLKTFRLLNRRASSN